MQIHKGHDQDIFGLMGKHTKIFPNFYFSIRPLFSGIPLIFFKVMFSSLITFLLLCNIGCCIYNRKEDKLKYCDKYLPTSCIPRQRLSTFGLQGEKERIQNPPHFIVTVSSRYHHGRPRQVNPQVTPSYLELRYKLCSDSYS